MKVIELTRGLAEIVDDDIYDQYAQYHWNADHKGYARRSTRINGQGRQITIIMHRAIMGAKPGEQIDHINGNKQDNRRCNLRFATAAENARNRKLCITNKLGVKGVSYREKSRLYYPQIKKNGKRIYIGCFKTLEEAKAVYDKAAVEHFGEFARLN